MTDFSPIPDAELATLLQAAPIGLFHTDLSGTCKFVNPYLCTLLGRPAEDLRGMDWLSILHREDRQRVFAAWRKAASDRKEVLSEFRITQADGVERWVSGGAVPLLDQNGRAAGFVCTVRDITHDRLMEEQARNHLFSLQSLERVSKALLRANGLEEMMVAVLDAVLLVFQSDRAWLLHPCDPDAEYWRLAMERTGNGSPAAFAQANETAMRPEARELFRSALAADRPVICHAGQGHSMPLIAGAPCSCRAQMVTAIHPRIGKPWLLGIHQCSCAPPWPVEEQRLFEEVGRRIAAALSSHLSLREAGDRENRYRELVEETDDLIIRVDRRGRIAFMNQAVAATLGFHPEEGPGLPFDEVIHPDDRQRTSDLLATWSRQGLHSATVENRTINKRSGRIHHMLWMVNLCYDSAGELQELRAIGRDMTEQILAAQEVRALEQRLLQAQKMEAVGSLAGGIAHQFNNILTAIIGYSALADRLLRDGSEAGELITQIRHAAGRAKNLVQQILTFSRGSEQKKVPVELHRVAQETLVLLRGTLPSSVVLRADIDACSGVVFGDFSLIQQIIMNLCNNACQAMRQSGGTLEVGVQPVEVHAKQAAANPDLQPGPYVLLLIRDTGPGMDQLTQARIFEPFFSTEGDPGSGMGLPVVYGIVKAHNGAVSVESKPGAGTTVSIYLPRQHIYEDGYNATAGEEFGGGEHILVVDDEKSLVALSCNILSSLGYRVTAVTASLKALERFRKDPSLFDLVITDLVMPGLSGLRLNAEIKRLHSETPVIICTGSSDVLDQQSARALGFHSLLMKPYSPRQLARAVRAALNRSSAAALPS